MARGLSGHQRVRGKKPLPGERGAIIRRVTERMGGHRRVAGWRSRVACAALYVPLLFVQVHALWIERVGVAAILPTGWGGPRRRLPAPSS